MVLEARLEEGVRMVADVVCDGVRVGELEEAETGNLMQVLLLLVDDCIHITLSETISGKQLPKVLLAESLEWTAVVLAVARSLRVHHLLTVPRLVVVSLTFLTITMSDVVSVVLFKLVRVDLLAELTFPELNGLVDSESKTLQIETKLQSTIMLQVTLVSQGSEQHLHTRREALPLIVVQVLKPDLVPIFWRLHLRQVEINRIVVAQIDQQLT